MKSKYSILRGFKDVLPNESHIWGEIIQTIKLKATAFGFQEIILPILEETDVFYKSTGETTDIVSKEMYSFIDKGERNVTMRPEGTPSCIRSFLENNLPNKYPYPIKLFYIGPMFRYERPQSGRLRQHTQYGFEIIGDAGPEGDVDLVDFLMQLYDELGISGLTLEVNSIGCPKCRPTFREKLVEYLNANQAALCGDCLSRKDNNPLRVLDCKNEKCIEVALKAPSIIDCLCIDCVDHFNRFQSGLENLGYKFNVNPKLVRGLDYYTRTTFEINCEHLGAQKTIAGGGRYDGLVELMGGDPTPCVGFGAGIERLILVLEKQEIVVEKESPKLALLALIPPALTVARTIAHNLRGQNIWVERNYEVKPIKKLIAWADKLGAEYAAIIGEDEIAHNTITLKNMKTGDQKSVKQEELLSGIDCLF